MGTLSPRVKQLDVRLTQKPSSAEVKSECGALPLVPLYAFMVYAGTLSFTSISVETSSGGPLSLLLARNFLQGIKWLGPEDDHSPVHNARFKNV